MSDVQSVVEKFCECGCGDKIPLFGRSGKPSGLKRYRRGHRKTAKVTRISCACGCGNTLLDRDGQGRLRRYIDTHQSGVPAHLGKYIGAKGDNHPSWRGGRIISKRGYVLIHLPDHPFASVNGYVYEHRLVMERYLIAILLPWAVVHHINHNKQDNRIENLQLMSNSEHTIMHKRRTIEESDTPHI